MTVVTYGGTLSHEEMDMIKEKGCTDKRMRPCDGNHRRGLAGY